MKQPMILQIPKRIYDEIIAHARAELPNECVGMLAGTPDEQVKDSHRLINELHSPTRFLSEPYSMLAAEKKRRAAGLEVLAIYHSHPSSQPVPSKYDLADHLSPDILSIIISLATQEPSVKAWEIGRNSFKPALFELVE